VKEALTLGLAAIAITDHDTVDGIDEALAAARTTSLEVVPGLELSTDIPQGEVHMLGFYVEHRSPALLGWLAKLRQSRLGRGKSILEQLTKLGLRLDWERVQQIAGTATLGRPHIARAMVESGLVANVDEAFDRYIGRNRPAYVDRYKLTPRDAVKLIREAHGLPVLAHPLRQTHLVPDLVQCGLVGMEAFYSGYAPDEVQFLLDVAHKHGIVPTGGSDYHGGAVLPENHLGQINVPVESLTRLRRLRQHLFGAGLS